MPCRTASSVRMSKVPNFSPVPCRASTTFLLNPQRGASGVPCAAQQELCQLQRLCSISSSCSLHTYVSSSQRCKGILSNDGTAGGWLSESSCAQSALSTSWHAGTEAAAQPCQGLQHPCKPPQTWEQQSVHLCAVVSVGSYSRAWHQQRVCSPGKAVYSLC